MTDEEWSDGLRVTAEHLAIVARECREQFQELASRAAQVYDLAQCGSILVAPPDRIERCQRQNDHDGPCWYANGSPLGEAIRTATRGTPEEKPRESPFDGLVTRPGVIGIFGNGEKPEDQG